MKTQSNPEQTNNTTFNYKFFFICNGFPSALFDTLEQAENSAEMQMTNTVKFYEIRNSTALRYVYTAHYNDTQERLRLSNGE